MIVGYHLIFSAYGFWLPNDPRGSWSEFVGSWDLFRYGPATRTTERRSLAHDPHDRARRLAARSALKFPPVNFTGEQARAVARGFGRYLARSPVPVWACAILPDHVHLVTGRSDLAAEQLVVQLKGAATRQLIAEGLHPQTHYRPTDAPQPNCWSRGQWKVYLDPGDIARAVRYVEGNPPKEGKRPQKWSFVTPVR